MSTTTKKQITENVLHLLETQTYETITVKNIVKACNINRKTFYYYFADKYDIVAQYFSEQLTDYLPSEKNAGLEWLEALKQVLAFFKDHKNIIINVYKSLDYHQIQEMVYKIIMTYTLTALKSQIDGFNIKEEDIQILSSIISNAISSTAIQWIKDGMTEDPVSMVDHYAQLFNGCIPLVFKNAENANK